MFSCKISHPHMLSSSVVKVTEGCSVTRNLKIYSQFKCSPSRICLVKFIFLYTWMCQGKRFADSVQVGKNENWGDLQWQAIGVCFCSVSSQTIEWECVFYGKLYRNRLLNFIWLFYKKRISFSFIVGACMLSSIWCRFLLLK